MNQYTTELDGREGFISIWQPSDCVTGRPLTGTYFFRLFVLEPPQLNYELTGSNGMPMATSAASEAVALLAIKQRIKQIGVEPKQRIGE